MSTVPRGKFIQNLIIGLACDRASMRLSEAAVNSISSQAWGDALAIQERRTARSAVATAVTQSVLAAHDVERRLWPRTVEFTERGRERSEGQCHNCGWYGVEYTKCEPNPAIDVLDWHYTCPVCHAEGKNTYDLMWVRNTPR